MNDISYWAQIVLADPAGPGRVMRSPTFTNERDLNGWVATQRRELDGRDFDLLPYRRESRGDRHRDVSLRTEADGTVSGPPRLEELRTLLQQGK